MELTNVEWTAQRLPDGRMVPGSTTNGWSGCTKHLLPSGKVDKECVPCYAERDEDARRGRSEWGKGKPRTPFTTWKKTLVKLNSKAKRDGVYPFNFISSLSDWADQEVDEAWRDELVDAAYAADHMTHLFLTKRAIEGAAYMMKRFPNGLPPHFWFGVSAGEVEGLEWRLEAAQRVKAPVIFISMEPLAEDCAAHLEVMLQRGARLDWLLTGGPSGPFDDTMYGKKRIVGAWRSVAHSSWYENLMAVAGRYGVRRHFKQWGNFAPRDQSQAGVVPLRGVRVSRDGERELFNDGLVARDTWTDTDSSTFEVQYFLGGSNGKHAHGRTLNGHTYDEHPPVRYVA
jgi:protein gp37